MGDKWKTGRQIGDEREALVIQVRDNWDTRFRGSMGKRGGVAIAPVC